MKLISLWEPFATLMSLGKKQIETRSWSTSYRGWLAIHASKGGLTMEQLEFTCWEPEFRAALETVPDIYSWMHQRPDLNGNRLSARRWDAFPFGCIVAVVRLEDCLPTSPKGCLSSVFEDYPDLDTPREREFGDYHEGRWGWVTTDLFRLPRPISFKAAQGLIEVPADVVEQLREQWKERAV